MRGERKGQDASADFWWLRWELREEGERGRLLPGFVADLAVWGVNPLKVDDLEVLKDMMPSHISVGGKFVKT